MTQLESLSEVSNSNFWTWVMCVDRESYDWLKDKDIDGLTPLYWCDIADEALIQQREKHEDNIALFCWASKSFFMRYLLENYELKSLIYLDTDILFLDDPSHLFADKLERYDILLTPHYYSPLLVEKGFGPQGIYNGGFIGVSKEAINFLTWWQERCFERCEWDFSQKPSEGGAVDQGYLDIVPESFHKVEILPRRYNLAPWNIEGVILKDNKFEVDGEPLVFFHFHQLKIADWRVIDRNSSPNYDISHVTAVYDRFDRLLHQAAERYDVFSEKEKLNEPLDIFHSTLGTGNLYLNQGKLKEAEGKYKKALAIKRLPDEARYHILVGLAKLYARKGEGEKAEERLNEASFIDEVPKETRFQTILALANCYLNQEKYKEAEEKLTEALSIEGVPEREKVFANYNFGSMYERKGDYAKAKDKFETVLALAKDSNVVGNAHFHLGCISQTLEEREKAKKEFEECLRFIPDHKKAKKNLEKF